MTLSISILLVFYPYSADDVYGYLTAQCPTGNWLGEGGGSGSGSGSNDNDNGGYDDDGSNYDYSYLSAPRYGKVKDYGYSCDRCVCYTDGTGCDCDDQDEWRALMNVASYGPATVCLDASAWQDYGGGDHDVRFGMLGPVLGHEPLRSGRRVRVHGRVRRRGGGTSRFGTTRG